MDGKAVTSAIKQYYVAVGSPDVKLSTLVDLLLALQADGPFGMAVMCSSRDTLDALVCALLAIPHTAVSCLHSDLSEQEQGQTLANFLARLDRQRRGVSGRAAPAELDSAAASPTESGAWRDPAEGGAARIADEATEAAEAKAEVLAGTDACLRGIEGRGQPLGLPLLINYDLPHKREVHSRRISAVLGRHKGLGGAGGAMSSAERIVVHFVVAGELERFRQLEGWAGAAPIREMPVHVSDILGTRTQEGG